MFSCVRYGILFDYLCCHTDYFLFIKLLAMVPVYDLIDIKH